MSKIYPECTLHPISEHVWWFTPEDRTDRPSLCAVVGDNKVALLDIGASPAHTRQFLAALTSEGITTPDSAVVSHWHWDHVCGMEELDCLIIAHDETATNIQRMMTLDYSDANLDSLVAQGHEVPFTTEHLAIEMSDEQRKNLVLRYPDITFKDNLMLHLGDVSVNVQHVGGDHASDALIAYVPEDKVLFLSDCYYYTVYQLPEHYTEAKVIPLIDRLQQFDAEQIILGHSNIILDRDTLHKEFALIRDSYRLLHQHGTDTLEAIKAELYQVYDNEDVDDFLEPILAGLNL